MSAFFTKAQYDTSASIQFAYDIGYYVVEDSNRIRNSNDPFLEHHTKFGISIMNPAIMQDQVLLDTNFTMISRMVNNQNGYTFYNWSDDGTKIYEKIALDSPFLEVGISYHHGPIYQEVAAKGKFRIEYFDTVFYFVKAIKFTPDEQSFDSLISQYNIQNYISSKHGYYLRFVVIYYLNGRIENQGLTVSEDIYGSETYKIGKWIYYEENGELISEENFAIPALINDN